MTAVGLDFGTTNSILAYTDGAEVRTFRYGGASATDYVPSVLSYEAQTRDVAIGRAARIFRSDPDHEVLERFKLFLGEDDPNVLARHGYARTRPERVTEDYLTHLLAAFRREHHTTVDRLVLSVPEVWVGQGRHAAREHLRVIADRLGVPEVRFLSEPVSAAALFCARQIENQTRPFQGHLLVCDLGGGTFDLSLSRVENNVVQVVDSMGSGYDAARPGRAGVAFDERVLELVLGRPLERTAVDETHRTEFETNKVVHQDLISRRLDTWLKAPSLDQQVFKLGGGRHMVRPSHLHAAFEEVVAPDLKTATSRLIGRAAALGVDVEDRSRFRVLLVGGFSSFHLVRRLIRHELGAGLSTDARFDSGFSLEDTALAIAKGAALVSSGQIEVEPSCPIGVGVRVHRTVPGSDRREPPLSYFEVVPLLRRGDPVRTPYKPVFLPEFVVVKGNGEETLEVVLDDGQTSRTIDAGHALHRVLPGFDVPGNRWRVGFSVDRDLLFRFHAVDTRTEEKVTPLGDLFSREEPYL